MYHKYFLISSQLLFVSLPIRVVILLFIRAGMLFLLILTHLENQIKSLFLSIFILRFKNKIKDELYVGGYICTECSNKL